MFVPGGRYKCFSGGSYEGSEVASRGIGEALSDIGASLMMETNKWITSPSRGCISILLIKFQSSRIASLHANLKNTRHKIQKKREVLKNVRRRKEM